MGLMRSRQRGNPCAVPGHGSRCEAAADRRARERAHEKRDWHRETDAALFDAPARRIWRVVVEVPADLDEHTRNDLFTAVADAVHDWEPADRGDWDPDVYGELEEPAEEVDR